MSFADFSRRPWWKDNPDPNEHLRIPAPPPPPPNINPPGVYTCARKCKCGGTILSFQRLARCDNRDCTYHRSKRKQQHGN